LAFLDPTSRSITQYFILRSDEQNLSFAYWIPFILLHTMIAGLIITKNYIYHSFISIIILLLYIIMITSISMEM